MKQEIFQCLRQIIDTYGEDILEKNNRRRFAALLEDYTKNKYRQEVYLLCESLQLGIYHKLLCGKSATQCQNLCFKSLTEEYCLTEDAAKFIIAAWDKVLHDLQNQTVPRVLSKNHAKRFAEKTVIHIPEGVKIIGDGAFADRNNIEQLIMPDSVVAIGKGAFCLCKNLKRLVLPRSVQRIGSAAFWGCESLQEIALPDTVEYIGRFAFDDCKKLLINYQPGSYSEDYCRKYGLLKKTMVN